MTVKELAQRLDGREYGDVVALWEQDKIAIAGLVVAYGHSDDLLEFEGAIYDEIGACNGATVHLKNGALISPYCDCEDYEECSAWDEYHAQAKTITAVWHDEGDPSWTIETDIPHETFRIFDGGEVFSVGIVFRLEDTQDKPVAGKWISVEDKLPEPHRLVLVWDAENGEMLLSTYQETGGWCSWELQEDANVTHWMPLPEPPEEE